MRLMISGIIPAIVTPFTKGGEHVDYEKAYALASWLADSGIQGIFACGTTGEGLLQSLDERKRLVEGLVSAVGSRIKVVAQTGCLDTTRTIDLTRHARDVGASAAAIVAPSFYAYDDASLTRHYTLVAKAVPDLPILLYNIPQCTGNPLSDDFVLRMASQIKSVVGIKDSSGDLAQVCRLIDNAPTGFGVINGADELSFQAYLSGAKGTVSSTANVIPELFLSIFKNVKKGNLIKARADQKKLGQACQLFQYGKMIAFYKEGLRLRGVDAGYVRPPQRELTTNEREQFTKAIEKAELF